MPGDTARIGQTTPSLTRIDGIRPGLRVMISGAGSGIGRAMVEVFTAHGARLHICDAVGNHLQDCVDAHPDVGGTVADVADADQVAAWFAAAESYLGGLDILINNAGIAGPTAPVEDISLADWRRTIDVDINGMFYATRLGVPLLKRAAQHHGEAAIVNLSSVAGKFGFARRTPYAFAKWGVVGFTKSLSIELGPFGIRANAIQPGVVDGERVRRVARDKAASTGRAAEAVLADMVADTSLGRMVSPYDVANMALFLCSPLARNVSGQAIPVCGDQVKTV